MYIAKNIRYLRRQRGWSQDYIADKLGYKSYTTIQKWESGASEPPLKSVHALANLFGVDIDDLTGRDIEAFSEDDGLPSNIIPLPKTKKVPLLGTIACGQPILAVENIDMYVDVDETLDADFCLRCKGDSMINARICDGDLVYIRQQPMVEQGEIAAVRIEDEATLKRVYLYDDHIVLQPENAAYEPLTYIGERMNEVEIIGKAVAFTSMIRQNRFL